MSTYNEIVNNIHYADRIYTKHDREERAKQAQAYRDLLARPTYRICPNCHKVYKEEVGHTC